MFALAGLSKNSSVRIAKPKAVSCETMGIDWLFYLIFSSFEKILLNNSSTNSTYWTCALCCVQTLKPSVHYQMKIALNVVDVVHLVEMSLHTKTIENLFNLSGYELNGKSQVRSLNIFRSICQFFEMTLSSLQRTSMFDT